MKHSPFVSMLIFVMAVFVGVGSLQANSFRRDKTNTSSNPGWPMNVPDSDWPSGIARTQANADSINAHFQDLIAKRYGWTTNGDPKYIDAIKTRNSSFGWLEYNSFQDNYVSGSTDEHDWLVAQCKAQGVNPERLYLHYYDATTVTLQGISLTFPGIKNARSLTDTINSRLPVYYSNRSRIVPNYSDPVTRQLEKKYACVTMTTLRTQGSYVAKDYVDGIFWDNSAPAFWNTGTLVSGGHISEHPQHARVDSIGSRGTNWWWTANILPFFSSLMDTLKTSTTWSKDHQQKRICINTSGTLYDPMATNAVATYFGQEGCYSPLKIAPGDVQNIYRYDSLSAAHGVGVVYGNPILTSVSGYAGTYTYREALFNNLCLFYVVSSDSSWFSPTAGPGPWDFGWDTLSWIGAMDYDLGPHTQADRKYSIAATGTDPKGYSYTVFSRTYPRAKVFIRPRGRFDQTIDAATAVSIGLGGTYKELRPDGSLGSNVTTAMIRNGQGKIFVPATSGSDVTPPSDIKDLSAIAGPSNGSLTLTWTAPGDDQMAGRASNYVIKYALEPLTAASWDAAPSFGDPPAPRAGGEPERAVISGLAEGKPYYVGVRATDDAGNTNGLSNEAISFSRGIQSPKLDTILVDRAGRSVRLTAQTVLSYYQVNYEFQVDTLPNFQTARTITDTGAGSATRASAVFSGLQENAQYYWRCRAVATDGSNASSWSPVGTFRPYFGVITGEEEYQVKISGPSTGVVYQTSRPILVVNNISREGRNFYFFEVAADTAFAQLAASSPAVEEGTGTTVWQVDRQLQPRQAYYWRARANGYPFSAAISFSIQATTHAYPNPVHLSDGDRITFTELPTGSSLTVTTLSGELVRRWTNLTGEDLAWDGANESGHQLSSGTYLWYIEDSHVRGKLVVIR